MGNLSNTTINGVSYDFKDAGAARQSHTHTKSQITDFPTSMPASDVPAWAKASTKPTYTQDEVGDGNTYKRVTSTEKNTWNNKGTYSKPSGGIPKTDLASAVQTLLDGIPSPPSGFTGFATCSGTNVTTEDGGYARYGPIVFIDDKITIPSGESTFYLFYDSQDMRGSYIEGRAPLPPVPTKVNSEREIYSRYLPVYDPASGNILTDCKLYLYMAKKSASNLYDFMAYIKFNTPPTSDTPVVIRLNYIGKKPW